MATNFNSLLVMLEEMGVMDSLLPFMLIFTIIYAVLEKTKIIGEGKKNFNVIIALAISLMVIIPHVMGTYPEGSDVVEIINTAIPNVSVIAIAIIMALILIGVAGFQTENSGFLKTLVMLISLGSIVYFFGAAAGIWGTTNLPDWLGFLADPDTQALIIIILVFGLIVMFVTAEPGQGAKLTGPLGDIFKSFKDSIRKV